MRVLCTTITGTLRRVRVRVRVRARAGWRRGVAGVAVGADPDGVAAGWLSELIAGGVAAGVGGVAARCRRGGCRSGVAVGVGLLWHLDAGRVAVVAGCRGRRVDTP
jgi:hypothetical protein